MLRVRVAGRARGAEARHWLPATPRPKRELAPWPWGAAPQLVPVFIHVRAAASPAHTCTRGQNEGDNHFQKLGPFRQKSLVPQV